MRNTRWFDNFCCFFQDNFPAMGKKKKHRMVFGAVHKQDFLCSHFLGLLDNTTSTALLILLQRKPSQKEILRGRQGRDGAVHPRSKILKRKAVMNKQSM